MLSAIRSTQSLAVAAAAVFLLSSCSAATEPQQAPAVVDSQMRVSTAAEGVAYQNDYIADAVAHPIDTPRHGALSDKFDARSTTTYPTTVDNPPECNLVPGVILEELQNGIGFPMATHTVVAKVTGAADTVSTDSCEPGDVVMITEYMAQQLGR